MRNLPSIGVREAKAQLSRLLRDVQRGAEWIVTDRGKPIAKITPVSPTDLSLAARLTRLQETGAIEPPKRGLRKLPPPLPLPQGLAQKWLDEDRGS